ncbi:MAG: hypothetical protein DRO23_12305, partial [Thermoprotei archaeon]
DREFSKLEIVDPSGAVDAWISSFTVFHLIKGMSLEKTIKLSNISFKIACSRHGVLNALPQIHELEKYVSKE